MWLRVASSWCVVLVVVLYGVRLYNPSLYDKLIDRVYNRYQAPTSTSEPVASKRQKAKRALASGTSTPLTSNTDTKVNKKRKIVSAPIEDKVVAQTTEGQKVGLPRDENDDMSNKEFAARLAKAQTGTKFEANKTRGKNEDKKGRRVAAKAAQPNNANGISTETSENDTSTVGSPSTGPISTAPTSRAGDISDMLEAPAAKPGVLRLTDVKTDASKAPPKNTQQFQPALSKKQRQRQAQNAENKAMREEADRIHEQKKQAQLRGARMAEGTSNQSKANNFTSQQNAWQSSKPASEKIAENGTKHEVAPLLDTFNPEEVVTPSANGAVTTEPLSEITNDVPSNAKVSEVKETIGEDKTSALAASEREDAKKGTLKKPALTSKPSWADEVNDEEQAQWQTSLVEEEKWESVTTKKGKKKSKRDNDTPSEASSVSAAKMPTTSKPAVNGNHSNGIHKARPETLNRFQSIQNKDDDSTWEA
jgi:hypothetical protein